MRKTIAALVALLLGASLAGCTSGGERTHDQTLTVLAAASLTGTFTELAKQFEEAHPGVRVKLVFDSSATLADKVIDGAPGDVLATADEPTMDRADQGGGTQSSPLEFATNVEQVAVPAANPAGITSFADLQKDGVDYVTCVTTAPCGATAEELLAAGGITHEPVSQEVDVKAVLAKVVDDEADAGLVYATDVAAAGDKVTGIDIPGADEAPNTYWAAVTATTKEKTLARQWLALLTSPDGRALLAEAGFGPPDER